MYDFGFGALKIPKNWQRYTFDCQDERGQYLMKTAGSIMYETTIPVDYKKLWDLRGVDIFVKIINKYAVHCANVIRSAKFKSLVETKKYDLIIVDHFLQECLTTSSALFNAPTVYFSNWPIADGYITNLNVPANPAAIPKTGTRLPGLGMTFLERVLNTVFHVLIAFARTFGVYRYSLMFWLNGYSNIDVQKIETGQMLYAGRSELIFDVVRPINNRVKHFGCPLCKTKDDYLIERPKCLRNSNIGKKIFTKNIAATLNDTFNCATISGSLSSKTIGSNYCSYNATVSKNVDFKNISQSVCNEQHLSIYEKRFLRIRKQFPELDLDSLENTKFAVMSFGSVAKFENMPRAMIKIFLKTFEALNYTVIWQTNSDVDFSQIGFVPTNIILSKWLPLKELLAHRNLLYFITHGGINTVNEILLLGVPIIALPLQGDQTSNLQRLVELNMGILLQVGDIWDGQLKDAIHKMEINFESFKTRARQISEMAATYRSLTSKSQEFWLHWVENYGKIVQSSGRRYFEFDYRPNYEYFAFSQILVFVPLIFTSIFVLSLNDD